MDNPCKKRYFIPLFSKRFTSISVFMGFDEDICQKMYIAGALHDIGKVAIGNEILEKPEKLTDEEFKTMKHHAVL